MKVIVDEGVPRHLVRALRDRGIDASRFRREGWSSLTNGPLIDAVEAGGFDVLVTNDKNIADQQSLAGRHVAVVALPHNRRRAIIDRVDDLGDTILRSKPGQHVVIAWDGTRKVVYLLDGRTVTEDMPPLAPFSLP